MLSNTLNYSECGLLLPQKEPYTLTLFEIEVQYGRGNHTRRNVFDGLARGTENMVEAGVERIILGGSFISQKQEPGDADIAWWYTPSIDWGVLDSVFQSTDRRQARGKYLIDHKIDGIEEVPYESTHEYFLRSNMRMPFGYQNVGIIQITFGG